MNANLNPTCFYMLLLDIFWRVSFKTPLEDEFFVPSTGHQNCLDKSLDVDWTRVRRSEDVQEVFWTSYIRSVHATNVNHSSNFAPSSNFFWFSSHFYYVKIIRIWSFSGPYFPVFGLNTERYAVSVRIQFECRKIRNRKTPNRDTFQAVFILVKVNLWLYSVNKVAANQI